MPPAITIIKHIIFIRFLMLLVCFWFLVDERTPCEKWTIYTQHNSEKYIAHKHEPMIGENARE
jgi:hypothetical protein